MNPDTVPKSGDLVNITIQAAQKIIEQRQPDGTIESKSVLNTDSLWWKTQSVSSNIFARFGFELKEFERQALNARNNMCSERAEQFAHEIMEIADSYRRSIDAKSSESVKDNQNSQSTYIDKVNRQKVERVYTMKDQAKKSLFDGFLGREREKDEEYE